MRTILTALMLSFATQASAQCGNLCERNWWKTATAVGVQAELDAGADVMARTKHGATPLHWAVKHGNPKNFQTLLAAGADAKAKNEEGITPWDLAQENEKLKGTKGYWVLNDAQYN